MFGDSAMKSVNLGIIGLGYVGNTHLRHSLKLANARLVAVSDLSKKALKKAKDVGVKKTYTNYKDLLQDGEIDAVIIALPTHLHLQCAEEAAEAKKHIFLEKPIARNVIEAREIISVSKRNSVELMIGYPLRFAINLRALKGQVNSGIFGDIEVAHATYVSSGPFFHRAEGYAPTPVPEWWFNKDLTGGGVLVDLGSHIINLVRWYFGEIIDIKSHLGYRFNMDLEDSAICLVKFDSGVRAVLTLGWFSQKNQLELKLFGTVSHASVQQRLQNPLITAIQMLTSGTSKFFQAHYAELQYFVKCLNEESTPSPSAEDGLKDLEAISLAYKNQIHLNSALD
jgi:UDP-N-acetylglucosamine 3-dehydrogenase